MKIGILTYHHAHNYGAYMQACALCNRLNMEENIECELIDFRMNKEISFYSLSKVPLKTKLLRPMKHRFNNILFRIFETAADDPIMKKSKERMVSDSIDDFVAFVDGRYDVIVAGSDEIWKTDGYRGFPTPYWLPGELHCRKFSYAASSRSDFSKLAPEDLAFFEKTVNDFAFIGVREQVTADSLANYVKDLSRIHVCCDPSFLYDFPVRRMPLPALLKEKSKLDPAKKTIVVMTNHRRLAFEILKACGRECNLVSVFVSHFGYHNIPDLTPLEWSEVIANADLMITTYFHGTCFSIIHGTPFLAVGSKARSSKLESLFDKDTPFRERYLNDFGVLSEQRNLKEFLYSMMKKPDTAEYVRRNREGFQVFLNEINQYE